MSGNKQQTAVNFLVDELIKLGYLNSDGYGCSPQLHNVIKQAKELNKVQLVTAYDDGQRDSINILLESLKEEGFDLTKEFELNSNKEDGEQYYKETFKTE